MSGNKFLNGRGLLEQIKQLHIEIHNLGKRLGTPYTPPSYTQSYVPYGAVDGSLDENYRFTYAPVTEGLLVQSGTGGKSVRINPDDTFGVDINSISNTASSGFNVLYSRARGVTEGAEVAISAGDFISSNFYRAYNGTSYENTISHRVLVSKATPGSMEGDSVWVNRLNQAIHTIASDTGELQLNKYVVTDMSGGTLVRTPSTSIAQFATDGTILAKPIATYASTALAFADVTLLANEFFKVANGDGTSTVHMKA